MKNTLFTITFLVNSLLIYSQCFDESNVYSFDYNGHTYKVIKENKDWNEASACAVEDGGYLTHIDDAEEQDALFIELTTNAGITESNTENQFSTSAVWIGGSDSQAEGSWIWDGDNDNVGTEFWSGGPNGSAVDGAYSNWGTSPAEPDNNVGGQDKLTLTIDSSHPNYGLWNDLTSNSSNTIYYVIEYNSIVSVEENSLEDEITIYPNPISDFVFVENNSQQHISKIEILNGLGQSVLEIEGLNDTKNRIEIPHLESGLYYLNLLLEDGNQMRYKIIR